VAQFLIIMKTIIKPANKKNIKLAAEIIKHNGLVAFPTETVYGLGANALSSDAIKKIYIAKGRPSDNPLIIHIAKLSSLENIADLSCKNNFDLKRKKLVEKLIKNFWPGALSIIFNKLSSVPKEICKLDTVAIRMPDNQIACDLINLSGVPIAAPSANISGRPSCTRAKHVIKDLNKKINMILCNNNYLVGLESTVIDMTDIYPKVLRPGAISLESLKIILGEKILCDQVNNNIKSPGMKYKHYAPQGELFLITGELDKIIIKINKLININKNQCIGVLATEETKRYYQNAFVLSLGSRKNLKAIGMNLFSCLREFDLNNIKIIYAESFEEKDLGYAIMNRMRKAADNKIIIA